VIAKSVRPLKKWLLRGEVIDSLVTSINLGFRFLVFYNPSNLNCHLSCFFQFSDIGANLVDEMYQGIYNGSKKHEPDLDRVLQRAFSTGLQKIFVTAGNLEESQKAAQLVADSDPPVAGISCTSIPPFRTCTCTLLPHGFYLTWVHSFITCNLGIRKRLYSTIGVHPTRCSEFLSKFDTPQEYVSRLIRLYEEHRNNIVALGEFGLDSERTNFCDIETQKK